MELFAIVPAVSASEIGGASVLHKSTNVTVDSSNLEPFSLNEKTGSKEDYAASYSDQNSGIEVNDKGESNLNMRF